MRILFNLQNKNPLKHPLMPDNYPFTIYELEDSHPSILELENQDYTNLSPEEFDLYKSSIDLSNYNQSLLPTLEEIVAKKIADASDFGEQLILKFSTENVINGIARAGKTEAVTKYLHFVDHYLERGSLYAAINLLNSLILQGIPEELAPFVTNEKLNKFKNQIEEYLELPLT